MKTVYSKSAMKSLSTYDQSIRKRIRATIEAIPAGDIKPIQGKNDIYRIRIGKFRALFSYIEIDGAAAVIVLDIGSRGDIYK